MAEVQRIPPDMTLGHCAICGDGFQYAKAIPRPPRTCGMLVCGEKVGEPWAQR